jgi:hypothetical protein
MWAGQFRATLVTSINYLSQEPTGLSPKLQVTVVGLVEPGATTLSMEQARISILLYLREMTVSRRAN